MNEGRTLLEQQEACGRLLTERYGIDWSGLPDGTWTWDRQGSALHCRNLMGFCQKPSVAEATIALGAYAQYCVECELTASTTDLQCLPLLQEAWKETASLQLASALDEHWPGSLPPPAIGRPRF